MKRLVLYTSTILLALSSCVTPKIHNALLSETENTKNALKKSKKRVIALTAELDESSAIILDIKQKLAALRSDSLQNGKSLVALESKYDALSDTYDLLVEFNNPSSVILHSWTGGRKWTKRFRELDVYFSISGIVTYETAKDLQLSVQEIPINRLLLETDTPYLTPMPLKGQDNRPNFIEHTASKISSLLNIDEKKLSEITIRNSRELLKRQS